MAGTPSESTRPLAWITGGATGIGFEAARQLAARGFRVAISGRRAAELEAGVPVGRGAKVLPGAVRRLAPQGVVGGALFGVGQDGVGREPIGRQDRFIMRKNELADRPDLPEAREGPGKAGEVPERRVPHA